MYKRRGRCGRGVLSVSPRTADVLRPFETGLRSGAGKWLATCRDRATGIDNACSLWYHFTNVVRNEWNFDAVVITDFKNDGREYMDIDAMIRAGGDIALATVPDITQGEQPLEVLAQDDPGTLVAMREACRHILYATVYSNAMNGLAPGSIISYTLAPWQIVLVVVSVVVYAFAAFVAVMLVLRFADTRRHPENYR